MARLSLTATQTTGTSGTPLDISAGCAANTLGSNTGVTFPWNPTYKLYVLTVTGSTTALTEIGTTLEGQGGLSVAQTLSTAAHIYEIGPFPMDEEFQGGTMEVDFGTPANVAGVFLVAG